MAADCVRPKQVKFSVEVDGKEDVAHENPAKRWQTLNRFSILLNVKKRKMRTSVEVQRRMSDRHGTHCVVTTMRGPRSARRTVFIIVRACEDLFQ